MRAKGRQKVEELLDAALEREAEARTLLMKTYELIVRTHGEQNPDAARTRRRLEQLGAPIPPTS